jgi:predicted anti-sigma-YlaC factor YlaD
VIINCKQASRLLSAEMDGRLTGTQRAALRLHLALCSACTNVKAQFEFLRRALRAYAGSAPRDDDAPR